LVKGFVPEASEHFVCAVPLPLAHDWNPDRQDETEVQAMHEPVLQPSEQQQQPAVDPQPVLAPQPWVVKRLQKNATGVAAAAAVGMATERIRGAAAAAPPTCAVRFVSSRRVMPFPFPLPSTTSRPCSNSSAASSSSNALSTLSALMSSEAANAGASITPSQARQTRAADPVRQ
jgi:hypothetical protein